MTGDTDSDLVFERIMTPRSEPWCFNPLSQTLPGSRHGQSHEYLRQYINARALSPLIVGVDATNRAKQCLQDLGGIGSVWDLSRNYCQYFYPQKEAQNGG